jgi:hypothetical protein
MDVAGRGNRSGGHASRRLPHLLPDGVCGEEIANLLIKLDSTRERIEILTIQADDSTGPDIIIMIL